MKRCIVFLSQTDVFVLGDKTAEEVIVIVPGEAILLTTVALPPLSRSRLLKAIPYQLEDKLIDDVNQCHFALADTKFKTEVPVAVVTQQTMEEWLNRLTDYGIAANALLPSMLALPYSDASWHVMIYADMAVVRKGKYAGFTVDQQNLKTLLLLALSHSEHPIESIHIYNFSDTPLALELNSIPIHETTIRHDQLMNFFDQWLNEKPVINLLQGNYRVKQTSAWIKKIMVLSGIFILTGMLWAFVSDGISYFILQKNNHSLELVINSIYKKHFPNATSLIAPRERMASEFKKNNLQQNNFLQGLSLIGQSLKQIPGLELQELQFKESEFYLTFLVASIDPVDELIKQLHAAGLTAKQQSAEINKNRIKVTLMIGMVNR